MRCLGLDIGSSSIKGAVLDLETSRVSNIVRESFPDPVAGMPSGFHEVSPEEIFTRAVNVIDRRHNDNGSSPCLLVRCRV